MKPAVCALDEDLDLDIDPSNKIVLCKHCNNDTVTNLTIKRKKAYLPVSSPRCSPTVVVFFKFFILLYYLMHKFYMYLKQQTIINELMIKIN